MSGPSKGRQGVKKALDSSKVDLFTDDPAHWKKPLFFPNHQRQFMIFTYGITVAATFYMTLFHDFGERYHIFVPLRRAVFGFTDSIKRKFMQLDPEEEERIKKKIDEIKLQK